MPKNNKSWFASDHHLGHANILTFLDDKNKPVRGKVFRSIEEHDEEIIKRHNNLVAPEDRVYFMGDVAMNKRCLPLVARMNGRKKLIKGNHDIFKLKDYTPYFEDIIAMRVYPQHGIIFTHVPVHTSQIENRFMFNVHGHLHHNKVTFKNAPEYSDSRYLNLSLECTDYKPVEIQDILNNEAYKHILEERRTP